ncbi:aspartate-semialdehyde dehydrogenase [Anaerolineales bacterium HSG24]|nr:aspartate-semialdehyde dehydrogenase [Anaerolineales bacterium HSG24]
MNKIRVGVLGATGAVGQRFAQLVADHPYFDLQVLAASVRSAGKSYREATNWILTDPMPESLADMTVQPMSTDLNCPYLFSALPTEQAKEWESKLAGAGYGIFSNAGAHRMDEDVPLLIPEVNPDHLQLLEVQRAKRGWSEGFIVTNPNCTSIPVTMALAPLHAKYGVESAITTSMQAASGAGYPGVPSLDLLDNLLPFVAESEEVKMGSEPNKMLGSLTNGKVEQAGITISAHCNRVPVTDGHTVTVSAKFRQKISLDEILETWQTWRPLPQQLDLPWAPQPPLVVRSEQNRPQPRLDRDEGRGMAAVIGRLRPCEVLDVRFVCLAHNTIRGAAGGSVLNAELMYSQGMLGNGSRE